MWGELVARQLETGTASGQVATCTELRRCAGLPRWASDLSAQATFSALLRTLWGNSGDGLTQMSTNSRSCRGRQAQK